MKICLNESGIQNMRKIAQEYSKAIIYFHIDLDGVTSAIAAKYYLQQYGIETIKVQRIQYGSQEWSIIKPEKGILPVLVDFSHGKTFMRIHTDHHSSQIAYKGSSQNFRHSKSNAETLSSIISTHDIFSQEDIRIINMVDSAGYAEENVSVEEIFQSIVKIDKSKDTWKNHLQMGMVAGKLLLTYKNKPNYLERIIMESKPSLLSMYLTMVNIIKEKLENKEKGWYSLEQIQANNKEYREEQESKKIEKGDIDSIISMKNGSSLLIGDCIVQTGGGNMRKSGGYDRYTSFYLYPDAKYFLMLWTSLGMIQLSKNPWDGNKSDTHLGDLVINEVIDKRFKSLLNSNSYRISLLAIKFNNEEKLDEENEEYVNGYKFDDLERDYPRPLEHMSDKQKFLIKKYMNWKPSDFLKKDEKDVERALDMLTRFYVPLYDIIKLQSGGHPSITNITGIGYIDTQTKVNSLVKEGKNPYDKSSLKKEKNSKDKDDKKNYYIRKSEKLVKYIGKEIVKELLNINKDKEIKNDKKTIKNESLSNERLAKRVLIKYLKNFDNSVLESLNESLYEDFYNSLREYYDKFEYKRQRFTKNQLFKGLCESVKSNSINEKLKSLIKNILI